MYEGVVVGVNFDRGFGFISRPKMKDLFFHIRDMVDPSEFTPQLQERRVTYDIAKGTRGGPVAVNIRLLS